MSHLRFTQESSQDSHEDRVLSFPHDKAFKNAMQNLQVARDFCTHYLPKQIQDTVDLNTLAIVHGSFVDEHLTASESDILYRVKTIDTQTPAYIYVLAEHQSKADRWLPFRLVKYMCAIADQHLKQHPKDRRLPLVVPIVFYNGIQLYDQSLRFFDLFESDSDRAIDIWSNTFNLVDLNHLSDEAMRNHQWSGLMEMVMKQKKDRDPFRTWQVIIETFGASLFKEEWGENYFIAMLIYSMYREDKGHPDPFLYRIRQQLMSTNKTTGDKIMTFAEQLIQRGMEQGMQMGRQEGMEEGMHQERLVLAKRMLSELHDIQLVAKITGLSIQSLKKQLQDEG